LLLGLHGAGASNQGDVFSAHEDVAPRRRDAQNAVFFLGVAADQFVGLADRDALDDAGKGLKDARSMAPLLPVMPMAVRMAPGMGWALSPRLSMR